MTDDERQERADMAFCLEQIAARLKQIQPRSLTPQMLRRAARDIVDARIRWMEG
jgi:hypothetical protein